MRILARVAEDPALSIAALADPELAGPAERMPASVRAMAEADSTQGEDDAEELSRVQGQAASGHHAETAQGDPRERMLTRIFQDVIGIEAIGPADNFFDLGGTSLLAIRLVKRVEQASGVRLNLIQLATGTVASLARGLPEAAPARGRGIGALWRRWTGRSASGKP
jgi:hypothetical protein